MSGGEALLLARYVKDLSFENIGAPATLLALGAPPRIDISFDVECEQRDGVEEQERLDEVVFTLSATAMRDSRTLWIAEVSYAGLFRIEGASEARRHYFVFVEAPRLLFPFVERVVADLARDGGLAPVSLTPPDFDALYRQDYKLVERND